MDQRIDEGLPSSILFSERSHSLLTILRAVEDRAIRQDLAIHEKLGGGAGQVASDLTRDAMNWAIKIAYRTPMPNDTQYGITYQDLAEAHQVLQKCVDYCEMEDVMTTSWRDGVEICPVSDGQYYLQMSDDLISHEAANAFWRRFRSAPDPPAPRLALDDLQTWINNSDTALPVRPEQLIFKMPLPILSGIQESMNIYCQQHWQLPQLPQSDQFDLKQFRNFWPALTTCAVVARIVFRATSDSSSSPEYVSQL